mmetsp:Transcript_1440/g.3110  ORF Transcript_1440/g.3110 Transcript_1440/m.3110 type:complete len:201 (-) Transcript_1440:461-1063(-)
MARRRSIRSDSVRSRMGCCTTFPGRAASWWFPSSSPSLSEFVSLSESEAVPSLPLPESVESSPSPSSPRISARILSHVLSLSVYLGSNLKTSNISCFLSVSSSSDTSKVMRSSSSTRSSSLVMAGCPSQFLLLRSKSSSRLYCTLAPSAPPCSTARILSMTALSPLGVSACSPAAASLTKCTASATASSVAGSSSSSVRI